MLPRTFALLAAVGALVSACGSGEATRVEVSGAWARTSAMSATNGAAYMALTSDDDDRLVDVRVDPSVAARAELHETVTAGMTGTTMGMSAGEMSMREVDSIDLPAGTAVALAPGGYHIMLFDLAAPLEIGSTIAVTLVFESADDLVVEVPVLDEAP